MGNPPTITRADLMTSQLSGLGVNLEEEPSERPVNNAASAPVQPRDFTPTTLKDMESQFILQTLKE